MKRIIKFKTYIPKDNVENFKDSLDKHGLAKEGNYEYCFMKLKVKANLNL